MYLKLSECERYQGDCNQAQVTARERGEREHYYHGFSTTGGLHTRLIIILGFFFPSNSPFRVGSNKAMPPAWVVFPFPSHPPVQCGWGHFNSLLHLSSIVLSHLWYRSYSALRCTSKKRKNFDFDPQSVPSAYKWVTARQEGICISGASATIFSALRRSWSG